MLTKYADKEISDYAKGLNSPVSLDLGNFSPSTAKEITEAARAEIGNKLADIEGWEARGLMVSSAPGGEWAVTIKFDAPDFPSAARITLSPFRSEIQDFWKSESFSTAQ